MLGWLFLIPILSSPAAPAVEEIHQLVLRLELNRALAAYESYARIHDGAAGTQALIRAADLATALSEPGRAGAAWLLAAERTPADPRAPGWRLRAGRSLHAAGLADQAREALAPLVADRTGLRPSAAERARAWLLLGRLDVAAGRLRRGRERLARAVAAWEASADADRLALSATAAQAGFRLAMLQIDRLDWSLPVRMDPGHLAPWLDERLAAIAAASERLDQVVRFGALRWSAAAALERARLLMRFQRWLWDFPPPPGLTPEQLELYRQAISDHGSSFEDQAVELLERVIWLVAEHHLAADIGRQARQELDRLDPALRWWHLRRPALPEPLPIYASGGRLERAAAAPAETPGDKQALLLAAEGWLVERRPGLATYILERLARASPEQRLLLVRALLDGDEAERAYPLVRALTREQPGLLPAWRLQVELELRFGDLRRAAESLAVLERALPAQGDLRACRAVVELGLGRPERAGAALEALVRSEPRRAEAHFDLALVLLAAGRTGDRSPADRAGLYRRAARHLDQAQALYGGHDRGVARHRALAAGALRSLGQASLAPSREEI